MFHLYFFFQFVKMSVNGAEYGMLGDPFLFDKDNFQLLFQGDFTAEIPNDDRPVEISLDTGEFRIIQTGHDENLNHVFQIKFFENDNQTCLFWGFLEMEYEGDTKYFCVTSQDFSTENGIDALRQILPEDHISDDILGSYPNNGEVQDEENDPALNLGDRFGNVADDASDDDASDDWELMQV